MRYPCPNCGTCFRRKGGLNQHVAYECGKMPQFQCPYCSQRSKLRSNMYKHIRAQHKGNNVWVIDLLKPTTLQI